MRCRSEDCSTNNPPERLLTHLEQERVRTMHTRGRYSAASLAVSPDGPPPELPKPPSYFNEREVAEWNALVNHLGPDFFPWESLALLACYVSVSCQLEAITRV